MRGKSEGEQRNYKIMSKEQNTDIALFRQEINAWVADKETFQNLLSIPFKGLTEQNAKRAMLEARMRDFGLQDFLEKNVYALPFKNWKDDTQEYSLATSIDYARKVADATGKSAGITAPVYDSQDDGDVACSITAKKVLEGGAIGDFTATVFFKEFDTSKNLWKSKPKMMIAKVAEMHALRKAFPKQLSQIYVEEEFEKKEVIKGEIIEKPAVEATDWSTQEKVLIGMRSVPAIDHYWADLSGDAKVALKSVYEGQRAILTQEAKDNSHEDN